MKAFYRCVNFQRHGQCSVTPVAPQRMPYTKHLLDTAHNVGKHSEMKPDGYYFIYLSFLPVSICGECAYIHICGYLGALVSRGTQGSCFFMVWWDVHARSISPKQGEEVRESPTNGARLVGGFLFCKLWLLFPVVHRPAVPRTRTASEKARQCVIHQQLVQRWADIKYKHHHFSPRIIMDLTASVLMHVSKETLSSLAWNCLPRRLPQYCIWEMSIWGFTMALAVAPDPLAQKHPGHAGGFGGSSGAKQTLTLLSYLKEINIRPTPKWLEVCLGLCSHAPLANTVFSRRGIPLNLSCSS